MTAEPRPAEEIRPPADIDRLVEQLSVQNFRPIRGELYAALSELRQHRSEVERLSAELTDAQAELSEAQHALGYLLLCHDTASAQASDWLTAWRVAGTAMTHATGYDGPALSAASPTTSDEPARCPHGFTRAHAPVPLPKGWSSISERPWCDGPGPAASGTPETTE